MAETSKSIQQAIDGYLNDKIDPIYSFVIRGLTGTCKLPADVHARFYDCNFESFETEGNNNIYAQRCNFQNKQSVYSLVGATLIVEDSTFEKTFNTDTCKMELINCTVSEAIFLKASSLKTRTCQFPASDTAKNAVVLRDNSRYESIQDVFGNFTEYFIDADEGSYVKFSSPEFDGVQKGVVTATNKSTIAIWGMSEDLKIDNQDNAFLLDNSSLEINNFSSVSFDAVGFNATKDSTITLRGIPTITSTSDSLFQLSHSAVTISGNETLQAEAGSVFEFLDTDNDVIIFGSTSIIASDSAALDITEGSFRLVGDGNNTISSSEAEAIKTSGTGANIFVKDINSVASTNSVVLDFENTNAIFYNVKSIVSNGNAVLNATSNCDIKVINVETIQSNTESTVQLIDNCSLTLNNVTSITGNGSDTGKAGIYLDNYCSLIAKNVVDLTGPGNGIDVKNDSTVLCDGVDNIRGGATHGIHVGVGCSVTIVNSQEIIGQDNGIDSEANSTIRLENVGLVKGSTDTGINAVDTDIFIDGSALSAGMVISGASTGINASASTEGSYYLNLQGPISVQAPVALNEDGYIINEVGVYWGGSVTAASSMVDTKYSQHQDVTASSTILTMARGSNRGLTVTDRSYYRGVRQTSQTAAKLISATAEIIESEQDGWTLQSDSSFLAYSSKTDVSGSASFIGAFNNAGDLDPQGAATLLAGYIRSGDVSFDGNIDPQFGGFGAVFSTGGNLGLESTSTLKLEGDVLTTIYRSSGTIEADNQIQIKVGSSTITLTTSNITVSASTVTI